MFITARKLLYVQELLYKTNKIEKENIKVVSYQPDPCLDAKEPAGHGTHSDVELAPKYNNIHCGGGNVLSNSNEALSFYDFHLTEMVG